MSSDIVDVMFGLLRSTNYETVIACLSFLTAVITDPRLQEKLTSSNIKLFVKLLKTLKHEYVYKL